MDRLSSLTEQQYINHKSLDVIRLISCMADRSDDGSLSEKFARRWPQSPHVSLIRTKAAITAGTPMTGNWGAPLVPDELFNGLVAFAAPFSVVARFMGTRVPFSSAVPVENTSLTTPMWAGPGQAKVVLRGSLDSVTLSPAKIAGIITISKDLARLGRPGSTEFLRNMLARAIAAFGDQQFTDPAVAAVPEESPASITNGLSPVAVTGDPEVDIANLIAEYVSNGGKLETAAFLLSSENAVALRLIGGDIFRELTLSGGELAGVPAFASSAVGDRIVLADRARVLIADDGAGNIDTTENATIEMRSDPVSTASEAGSPDEPVHAQMVSAWQSNLVAIRLERFVNWEALSGSVAFLDNANYLAVAGSPA